MKPHLAAAVLILLGTFATGADAPHPAHAPAPATTKAATSTPAPTPPPVVRGAVYQSASGTKLRILLDQEMMRGPELEIGEITFPPERRLRRSRARCDRDVLCPRGRTRARRQR